MSIINLNDKCSPYAIGYGSSHFFLEKDFVLWERERINVHIYHHILLVFVEIYFANFDSLI